MSARLARLLPSSVFGQLVLTVALVLLGMTMLVAVLGRELSVQPGARQLLQVLGGFAGTAEAVERRQSPQALRQALQAAGLEVRAQRPAGDPLPLAPLVNAIRDQGNARLGPGRAIEAERSAHGTRLWLGLATGEPLWVGFPADSRQAARRMSVLTLLGGTVLVWIAAALFARRLVIPLRALARQAPAIMRGEAPQRLVSGAPREVGELADALASASADVRAAAAERSLMLAGISHDLRTPLTRLQYALALCPEIEPALRDGMERDIGEIDAILSQFIAFARDGRDEDREPVDLAALCASVLAASQQHWQIEVPAQAWLHGRPVALARALENLVVNAERHAAPPFRLSLRAVGDTWRLEVADRGPGLSADDAQRALEPFVHAASSGGSGLGLAIVERIARQHGGHLALLAHPPHGLCAVLHLPATPGAAP